MLRTAFVPLAITLLACGGPPPGARRAQSHLDRGDYQAAEKEADGELARFPRDPTLWRIKVQAAMGRGDNAAAAGHYRKWKDLRGADDAHLLRLMAITTLWQGMRVASAEINVTAIRMVERHELEVLAEEVIERMGHDDDYVAAAAAVAVLRSHVSAGQIAGELLTSSDPRARAIAVEGVGRKVGKLARDDLVAALRDPDEQVRLAAVDAVAGLGDARDTAQLAGLARTDRNGPVRARALAALARGERAGTLEVARAGLADAYLGARLAAVELTARSGAAGKPALIEAAGGPDPFVALRAAVHLRKLGEPLAADPAPAALRSDLWAVRVAAVGAAIDLLGNQQGEAALMTARADARVEVRMAAARGLLRLGRRDLALATFAEALAGDETVRLTAATELLRADDPRGLPALAELAKAPSPDTRKRAVSAHRFGRRPSPELIAALADESAQVRLEAADTLLVLTAD